VFVVVVAVHQRLQGGLGLFALGRQLAQELVGSIFITKSKTPSETFSTTLPTKPSVTMTSAIPLLMSRPSTLPTNCAFSGLALNKACVSLARSWPFCSSEPTLSRPIVGVSRFEEVLGEDRSHDAVLVQVFRLGIDVGPDIQDDAGAFEGRHHRRDARSAHAFQEQTQTETARHQGAGVASTDDGVGLLLGQQLPAAADGVVGLLSQGDHRAFLHADGLGAVKNVDPTAHARVAGQMGLDQGLVSDQRDRSWGSARAACTAPATMGPGAWSPPIASSAICMGLLLLFRRHDFAALVIAAIRADAVRQHRFVALGTILDLHRFEVQMASPLALARVRRASLGNSHESIAFSESFWG